MAYLPPLNGGRVNVQISGNSTSAGAGYATISSGTMTLAGGNNITLSQNGNGLTISGGAGGAAGSNTLGMSNLGNTSGTTGVVSGSALQYVFAGGNNITLSQSVNASSATITVSGQNLALSAANGSSTFKTASFANSNGVSFSTGTQGIYGSVQTNYLTTARASTDAIGLNTAQTNATWTVNSSGLSLNAAGYAGTGFSGTNATATLNSNGLQLSVGAAGGGGIALYDGANSITSGTAYLSDANGVSLGINGQTVTASVSQTNQTLGFYATGNTTYNTSATFDARSLTIQGSGGDSVGFTNGSLVIDGGAGGANPAISFYQNLMPQNSAMPYTSLALAFNTMLVQPLSPVEGYGFPGDMTLSTFMMDMSATGTATSGSSSYASAVSIGLYLLNNSSQLTLVNSASTSWSAAANRSNTTGWAGARFLTIHSSQWSSQPVLSFGARYWYGVVHGSTNYSNVGASWIGQYLGYSVQRSGTFGVSQVTNSSIGIVPFLGIYSASLASIPVSLGNSQINKTNVSAGFVPAVVLNATFSAF